MTDMELKAGLPHRPDKGLFLAATSELDRIHLMQVRLVITCNRLFGTHRRAVPCFLARLRHFPTFTCSARG